MYLGQANQDKFILNILKEKRNGFFLEIGSTQYDWKGIMVEYESSFLPSYIEHRPNSIHLINDATTIDYKNGFETNNAPL